MVMPERTSDEPTRNGLRSQGHSPLVSEQNTDDSDNNGMRVGDDYQAKIPEYNPNGKIETKDAILVWAPISFLSDAKIDEYVDIAKEKHGYNTEQALGMLFWHKHNIDKALSDLANFTPFPDEWTVEDKVLFEQAFNFHGKSFPRIRQMLPDKSISTLIKYYYSWKKSRSRVSLMDRQAKKLANKDSLSDPSDEESDESEGDQKNGEEKPKKSGCNNCGLHVYQLHKSPKGDLCSVCYQYWGRTGILRSTMTRKSDGQNRMKHIIMKHKRKPPRGMHLTIDDLNAIAKGPSGQAESILKSLDSELISLRRQVQSTKQVISMQKYKVRMGIDDLRPQEPPQRIVSRWTNDELLLAVQGVRKYGKDFKAIAEVIGNKLEVHVRSFFVSFRRRYNLDEVLAEYELEHGMTHEKDEEEIREKKIEMDTRMDLSNQNTIVGDNPPSLTKQLDVPVNKMPLPSHARLLPPRPTILQQPPPLIRPNTIPPISEKSSA